MRHLCSDGTLLRVQVGPPLHAGFCFRGCQGCTRRSGPSERLSGQQLFDAGPIGQVVGIESFTAKSHDPRGVHRVGCRETGREEKPGRVVDGEVGPTTAEVVGPMVQRAVLGQ